jgi:hypothetical protein
MARKPKSSATCRRRRGRSGETHLVVIAAHIVAGSDASVSLLISVPVFMVGLAATRLLAGRLERSR